MVAHTIQLTMDELKDILESRYGVEEPINDSMRVEVVDIANNTRLLISSKPIVISWTTRHEMEMAEDPEKD